MQQIPDQEPVSLRAAVAWAQYLADAQGDVLVAALLEDVLGILDRSVA
jgi:hypothetical protein